MTIPWAKIGIWLHRVGLPWLGRKALTYAANKWLREEAARQEESKE